MPDHVTLADNHRAPNPLAERVGEVRPEAPVSLTVTLRGPALPPADDTTGPALSHAEYEAAYGARQDDVDLASAVLARYGLEVTSASRLTRSLTVSGTAAQVEAAFHPSLGMYHSPDQGTYRGREGAVHVPAELADVVTGVYGLDERRVARRNALTTVDEHAVATTALGPDDLAARYDFPSGDGEGQRIAIAEFGGTYLPEDLTSFCRAHDKPIPIVNPVPLPPGQQLLTLDQIGRLPTALRNEVVGETIEVMMDVEIVAGLCPKAEIDVYFSAFDQKGWVDLLDAVIAAEAAAPVTLSISWGLAEDSQDWSDAARRSIDHRLQALALLGTTVCVAAGDDGAGDQVPDGRGHVDFPASSAFVLGVGGTMIDPAAPGVDVVWWQAPGDRAGHGGSTGGGVSTIFERPAWQDVAIQPQNPGSIAGRVVPDVAALAGPPLYDLTFIGRSMPNGGTSASAPLWAALLARVQAALPAGAPKRFFTPLLYESVGGGAAAGTAMCTDVTGGGNRSPQPGWGFVAAQGYDAVSGWGTPRGTAIVTALLAAGGGPAV